MNKLTPYDPFANGKFIISAPDDLGLLEVLETLQDIANGIDEERNIQNIEWGDYVRGTYDRGV